VRACAVRSPLPWAPRDACAARHNRPTPQHSESLLVWLVWLPPRCDTCTHTLHCSVGHGRRGQAAASLGVQGPPQTRAQLVLHARWVGGWVCCARGVCAGWARARGGRGGGGGGGGSGARGPRLAL
jgi:hypothetical protein